MKLREIYAQKDVRHNGIYEWVKPKISFEIFPPQKDIDKLLNELKVLNTYNPEFISITCSAGNANNSSIETLKNIKNKFNINLMPHFTCICSKKEDIKNNLNYLESIGVENILALRGDEPTNKENIYKDFRYANDLVKFIKQETNLSVGVAGYPEGHIQATDIYTDIENLKKKVDAGAEAIFTQLFFNNDKFFSYIQLVRDAGIEIPIIAGIMPIVNYHQITKMLNLAKISVPKVLQEKIEKYKDNEKSMTEFGIDFSSYQCQQLIDAEVKGIHFYTLNKSYSTAQILENIEEGTYDKNTI